jgi:hypothetical protein
LGVGGRSDQGKEGGGEKGGELEQAECFHHGSFWALLWQAAKYGNPYIKLDRSSAEGTH